jgi:hypothetical protein
VTNDLYLINDSWRDARIHVDLLLTDSCPEFLPEAECFNSPRAAWSFDFDLAADSIRHTPVTWRLPAKVGNYWLTARTTGIAGRPVLSQRFVRAVKSPESPPAARQTTTVILGADERSAAYFQRDQLATTNSIAELSPGKHIVLVWNPAHLSPSEKQSARALRDFAAAGGRVVVLAANNWTWRELCEVDVVSTGGSRVFPSAENAHWLLRGVDPECLKRWNGLPGTVAQAALQLPAHPGIREVLWVLEQKNVVMAEVPVAGGRGSVLFCQLQLREHVNEGSANYDPVADQVLVNLLFADPSREGR